MPHVRRPAHDDRNPVHVSMRATKTGLPSLRSERVYGALAAEIAAAVRRGVRVLHYSVQHDHVHLVVEAADRVRLWRGVQRLAARAARGVNRVLRRRGSVWADRYHRRDLTSPRQTRNTLVYVLFNFRKHSLGSGNEYEINLATLDPCSSARWFQGWAPEARPPPGMLAQSTEASPLAPPRSWLARVGWMKAGGPIPLHAMPRVTL